MIFSEFRFLVFFAVVMAVHWVLRANFARKFWLLAASYWFYGVWDWRFLFLIFASTVIDYFAAHRLKRARVADDQKAARRWLIVSLVANLGILGFFKYYNFFAESAASMLHWFGLPVGDVTLGIVLPVGISFFTFQTMSYSIDVYRGKLEPVRNFFDFALFVSFFPQLVAGPIVRAIDFLPQLDAQRRFADIKFQRACGQFLSGFIKKACIADGVAPFVDQVFADPSGFTATAIWIGTCLYAVQIYCDFSGYSDMAIACARMLGFELRTNFDFPYLSKNITDFWRRWHISLSSWLRDYLYIALGGNRGTKAFVFRNLMLTMLLGGLWHGAGWNFVVWGAIHGASLIVHKEWTRMTAHRVPSVPLLPGLLTLMVVLLAWIFFRATTFEDAWTMGVAFLTLQSPGEAQIDGKMAYLLIPLLVVHWLASRRVAQYLEGRVPSLMISCTYGVILALALPFVPTDSRPFIYFQF